MKHYFYYIGDSRFRQRMSIALSKGLAMMLGRRVNLTRPETWEFSGFSQNGEDGIIDVLRHELKSPNMYFVEIGCADGLENNSSWLVVAAKYNGLMIDGSRKLIERARRNITRYSLGAQAINMFVKRSSAQEIRSLALHHDPDVFSLDIDGNDFHIAKALVDSGFRPKIFVVEYNSVFGPDRSLTIEYQEDFVFTAAHPTQLYYGVSISAWKRFFDSLGYKFVTVDRNGVNAFFVDPEAFEEGFLREIKPVEFAENRYQQLKFGLANEGQFALIADQPFVSV
jgi:hypothetical protein